jgi:hypothetical protein
MPMMNSHQISIDARTMTRFQMEQYNYYDLNRTMPEHSLERSQTEGGDRKVDETLVTQGTVLWLPAKEDLPERAVRRAHGKGAIEEGIFNHPIVVVSRPRDESHIIHFHLVSGPPIVQQGAVADRYQITSLQGKRLDQLYNKANEFHASRRSWFLPVAPTPDHPDALSKKTKKRFPTLQLSDDATLRWDSYVNIRHVYKIDLSLLRAYANPETTDVTAYQFERESLIRMIAKGKSLTLYEPGPQVPNPHRAQSEPMPSLTGFTPSCEDNISRVTSPVSDARIVAAQWPPLSCTDPQVDFRLPTTEKDGIPGPPTKVPPDTDERYMFLGLRGVQANVVRPMEQVLADVQSTMTIVTQRMIMPPCNSATIRAPLDRAWRDFKGVIAITIASLP